MYRNCSRRKRNKTKSTTNDTFFLVIDNIKAVKANMLAALDVNLTLEDIIGQDVDG